MRYLVWIASLLPILNVAVAQTPTESLVLQADPSGRYEANYYYFNATGLVGDYTGLIEGTLGQSTGIPIFCIDPYTNVTGGVTYEYNIYTPTDPVSLTYSKYVPQAAWLLDTYGPEVYASTSPVDGAALQLAIWDVVLDGGDGLASGTIQSAPTNGDPTLQSIHDLAASMITASAGQSSTNAVVLISVKGTNSTQSFISGPPTSWPTQCFCAIRGDEKISLPNRRIHLRIK